MPWSRTLLLTLLAGPAWGLEGFVVGAGLDADNEDALAATLSAELGLAKETWLSTAIAKSRVDLPRGTRIDTLYADIGLDHWFKPVGIRAGVAYWGDSDVLDSIDYNASVYWRSDKFSLSGLYEYRELTFDVFRDTLLPGQDFEFHADGVGLAARFELSPNVDFSFSGMRYDYDVNLKRAANRPIVDFLSVSRLSLLNSLTDYQARISLGVDAGDNRWTIDFAKSKGEVDARETDSVTLRFLTPMGKASDIEFGLGVDRAEDFGTVTLFSVFLYFYG